MRKCIKGVTVLGRLRTTHIDKPCLPVMLSTAESYPSELTLLRLSPGHFSTFTAALLERFPAKGKTHKFASSYAEREMSIS